MGYEGLKLQLIKYCFLFFKRKTSKVLLFFLTLLVFTCPLQDLYQGDLAVQGPFQQNTNALTANPLHHTNHSGNDKTHEGSCNEKCHNCCSELFGFEKLYMHHSVHLLKELSVFYERTHIPHEFLVEIFKPPIHLFA